MVLVGAFPFQPPTTTPLALYHLLLKHSLVVHRSARIDRSSLPVKIDDRLGGMGSYMVIGGHWATDLLTLGILRQFGAIRYDFRWRLAVQGLNNP